MASQSSSVPLLRATAHELQQRLATDLTSVELVEAALAQIERHNHNGMKLNAIVSVCPREIALEQAKRCDKERAEGKVRSALHGIPIVLKVEFPLQPIISVRPYSQGSLFFSRQDSIVTDAALGMPTSAGSFAFASMRATRNATLVDRVSRAT